MRVTDTKLQLVFKVESINDGSRLVAHVQCMLPYPARRHGEQAFIVLQQQAKHYDTQYHLVQSIRIIRKKDDR